MIIFANTNNLCAISVNFCYSSLSARMSLTFIGFWGVWGPAENCPRGGFATSFSLRVESPQGGGDDTALNSICLQCSTGGEVCSRQGYWGSWASSGTSSSGFNGAQLRIESKQGGGDDTAANNLVLFYQVCSKFLIVSDQTQSAELNTNGTEKH